MSSSPNDQNLTRPSVKGGVILEFEPTQEQRQEVKRLKGLGIPLKQIRFKIINPVTNNPITLDTLRKYFDTEIHLGQCNANEMVMGKLFEKCMDGEIKAISIWCNTLMISHLREEELEGKTSDQMASSIVNSISDMIKNATQQKVLEHEY